MVDISHKTFLNASSSKKYIMTKISLKIVPKDPIDNMSAVIQEMAWC